MGCHGSTKILRARSPKPALDSAAPSPASGTDKIEASTLPTLTPRKASHKVAPLPQCDDTDVIASPQLTPLANKNLQDLSLTLGPTTEDATYVAAAATAMAAIRRGGHDAAEAFLDHCEAAVVKAATKLAGLWEIIAEETSTAERTMPLVAAVRARNTLDLIHVLVSSGEPVSMQLREFAIKVSMAEELWVMRKSLLEATSKGDVDHIAFWIEQVRGTSEDVSVELAFAAWIRQKGLNSSTMQTATLGQAEIAGPCERSVPQSIAQSTATYAKNDEKLSRSHVDAAANVSTSSCMASPEHGSRLVRPVLHALDASDNEPAASSRSPVPHALDASDNEPAVLAVEAEAAAFVSTLPRRPPATDATAPASREIQSGSRQMDAAGSTLAGDATGGRGVTPLTDFARTRRMHIEETAGQNASYRMQQDGVSDPVCKQARHGGRPRSAPLGRHRSAEAQPGPPLRGAPESRFTLRKQRDEAVEAVETLKPAAGRPTSAPPRRERLHEQTSSTSCASQQPSRSQHEPFKVPVQTHLESEAAKSQSPSTSPHSAGIGSQDTSAEQDEETWEQEMRSNLEPLHERSPLPKPPRLPPLPPDVAPHPVARSMQHDASSSKPPSPPSPTFPMHSMQSDMRETPPPPPPLPLRRTVSTPPATTPACMDDESWWRPEWWDEEKARPKSTKSRKRFSLLNLNFHGKPSVFTRGRRPEACKAETTTSKPAASNTKTGERIHTQLQEKTQAAPLGNSSARSKERSCFPSCDEQAQGGATDKKQMQGEGLSSGSQGAQGSKSMPRTAPASSNVQQAFQQQEPPEVPRRWKSVRSGRHGSGSRGHDSAREDLRNNGHAGFASATKERRRQDAAEHFSKNSCADSASASKERKTTNAGEDASNKGRMGAASSLHENGRSDAKSQRKRPASAPTARQQSQQPMSLRESSLTLLGFAGKAQPSEAELKAAHKAMALKWHPDRPHNRHSEAEATDMFQAGREAYEYLLQEIHARRKSK